MPAEHDPTDILAASPRVSQQPPITRSEEQDLFALIYQSSGPYLDPMLAERFERIEQGLGVALVRQGIEQTEHRMRMELQMLRSDNLRSWAGLIAGFAVALSFLAASVYLTINGHDTVGGILGGTTVLGLVGAFIRGQSASRSERESKADRMADLLPSTKPT